ncbi:MULTISPECIES: hypothetical protein [unclassified Anaerobiospirillum]|uniref:hypothetical protein n=1 Tax=unclassified Anaerobiospirillum TaxID=2647410 RepID=UPI001FF62D32|nr:MULTISPECIES: hypothetical protein [unclassified Anaerobiospirillum]MCK0525388.1 hypothetical protein [Anaerobiospirillum sp. NML120449]MCK0535751.1 hypothetical protein [Anaerobiospirillum sp. NML120511]
MPIKREYTPMQEAVIQQTSIMILAESARLRMDKDEEAFVGVKVEGEQYEKLFSDFDIYPDQYKEECLADWELNQRAQEIAYAVDNICS